MTSAQRGALVPFSSPLLLVSCLLAAVLVVTLAGADRVLTPPNFNLAVGRKIEASSTCGTGPGVTGPELFCRLTGANKDRWEDDVGNIELIEGQHCDYCDPMDLTRTHLPEYAVDGTERWWQSPPLSRGMQYNEVNLTISLGQQFHVAYVFIKMANSPRPGVFALERSNDDGRTWQPWQYFADTPSDCDKFFGRAGYSQRITSDDSVICTTHYAKVVPLEDGEIVISLVNNRPSSNKFAYSLPLQEWTKATNVRLRLLRTKTLLGHLMAVARQDPTVTRRYYYSIKDISIGGRCVCNGHAASCEKTDPHEPHKLVCLCQHNTCGEQCNECCPGFKQKAWRPATGDVDNACEPCQCYGHTTECRYDDNVARTRASIDIHGEREGGGVCVNCQHHTTGVNCDRCEPGYYRPSGVPLESPNVCQRCLCDLSVTTATCEEGTGRCFCKPEFSGPNCDRCAPGYFRYPQCSRCQCNQEGTINGMCDKPRSQPCRCKPNFDGEMCDQCAPGYYGFPDCRRCECHGQGAMGQTCDVQTGQCRCRGNYGGGNCDQCKPGYYGFPSCIQCQCSGAGCSEHICTAEGLSLCRENFAGSRCEYCAPGYYNYPQCTACGCYGPGILGTDCDSSGQCSCKPNYSGKTCNQCAVGFSRYPECRECDCSRAGTESCDSYSGRCICKPNVVGPNCGQCAPDAFGYESGHGCQLCACGAAAIGPNCDQTTGQCQCRPGVTGPKCDKCDKGYWNYGPYGCQKCSCAGQYGMTCDTQTGRCLCAPGHTGRNCESCLPLWVAVPNVGCQECDSCVLLLLEDISYLNSNLTLTQTELANISAGVQAFLRLDTINKTAYDLRPLVDALTSRQGGGSQGMFDMTELNRLKQLSYELKTRSVRITKSSETVQNDATVAQVNAESLYDEIIRIVTHQAQEAVDYVRDSLRKIQDGVSDSDTASMLREAERMLSEIKTKNFVRGNQTVQIELTKSVDALRRAKELMDRAMGQVNRTTIMTVYLNDLISKLREIQNFSQVSEQVSQSSTRMNNQTQQLKIRVIEIVQTVVKLQQEIKDCLNKSSELLRKARQYLRDARQAYLDAAKELSKLDQAKVRIRVFTEHLSSENVILRPLVDNATEHALKLKRQAELLESMIVDTRHVAERALNASKAYQDIIDAINRALNASQIAIKAAEEAIELSYGHGDDARKAREKSEKLKTDAQDIAKQVEIELRVRLRKIKHEIEEWSKTNINIRQGITEIVLGMDNLPEHGYGDKARSAADRSMNAQRKAVDAETRVTVIVDHLPEDKKKADQIPHDIEEANRNVKKAQVQVEEVLKLVPTALDLLDRLTNHAIRIRKLGIDLKANITLLRNDVGVSRDTANLIKVGIEYRDDTQLHVRNPKNILSGGSYSKVSIYFRTNQRNGLLLYIGPDSGTNIVDYLALEIENGKVVFKYDLGSGQAKIVSTVDVSDGKWHEAVAERFGRVGNLTVRTDEQLDVVTSGESPSTNTVLQFNESTTRFYVGGVPDRSQSQLRRIVTTTRFIGCLEDVRFDGVSVGLWNFVQALHTRGCEGRDTLLAGHDNGFMFHDGYVILNKERFKPDSLSQVSFNFRTLSRDGLMFLIGQPTGSRQSFMSVEMKDGQVYFQYDLGSGRAELLSPERYNDGEWHTVTARRNNQDGLLKVDTLTVKSARSPGNLKVLEMDNFIHIGGHKRTHPYPHVTQKRFDGCIRNIQLGTTVRDITDNYESKGVLPGCTQSASVCSFRHDTANSYIAMDRFNIDSVFDMSLKIKTEEQDGLIAYMTDDTSSQQNAFSISMVGGKIVLTHVSDGKPTVMESTGNHYNDGRWHYINIQKQQRDILMVLDDTDVVRKTVDGKAKLPTSSPLYLGGIPPTYTIVVENVGTRIHFVGCIGDVIINGAMLDFSKVPSSNQLGTFIGTCHIADPTPAPQPIPSARPTLQPIVPPARERCSLPLDPGAPGEGREYEGIQFGDQPDSRQEFSSKTTDISSRFEFSIEIETLDEDGDGVIFYTSNDRHLDFISVFMQNGQISFAFNCGSGTGRVTTTRLYNDGNWHTIKFSRQLSSGMLDVDGVEVLPIQAPGRERTIEIDTPYYLGGLPLNTFRYASPNMGNISGGFVGCIRNVKLNDADIGASTRNVSLQSCSADAEFGSFFYSDGGYLVLSDNYSVPLDLEISVWIKPRKLTGVILSVHATTADGQGGDYLVLQLVNGDVVFNMDNSGGDTQARYSPAAKNELCDGDWHIIRAQKAKNVVTLEVDNTKSGVGVTKPGYTSTNTHDPLYIGGVPETHRGLLTRESYVGCLRLLALGQIKQNLSTARVVGKVDVNSCPSN